MAHPPIETCHLLQKVVVHVETDPWHVCRGQDEKLLRPYFGEAGVGEGRRENHRRRSRCSDPAWSCGGRKLSSRRVGLIRRFGVAKAAVRPPLVSAGCTPIYRGLGRETAHLSRPVRTSRTIRPDQDLSEPLRWPDVRGRAGEPPQSLRLLMQSSGSWRLAQEVPNSEAVQRSRPRGDRCANTAPEATSIFNGVAGIDPTRVEEVERRCCRPRRLHLVKRMRANGGGSRQLPSKTQVVGQS